MPQRNFLQYLVITAKGLAMGAADVVPGVSGGTIAFISGIYEELIETIHKLDLGFFKIWKADGFLKAWKHYNLGFLLALFSGVFISIISLAKLITWLLEIYPIMVWSFFFGLVIASIVYVGKQITNWRLAVITMMIVAAIASYLITIADPVGSPDSTWFLFFRRFYSNYSNDTSGYFGGLYPVAFGRIHHRYRHCDPIGRRHYNFGQFTFCGCLGQASNICSRCRYWSKSFFQSSQLDV